MTSHPDEGMGIGELARRTGVGHETLRAWERRYGLLRPRRTPGGHRRYADADLARVLQVLRLRSTGLPTSLAVARVTARPDPGDPAAAAPLSSAAPMKLRQRLWAATEHLDTAAVAAALTNAARQLPTVTLLDEVAVPVLHRLGDRWRQGPRNIAQEHVASTALRSWLVARLDETTDPAGPAAVVACPDGELHDLGAMMAALALADAGWRPVVLGASTPWASASTVIKELAAPLVLLGATSRVAALRLLEQWTPPRDGVVLVGGPALSPDDVADRAEVIVHRGPYASLAAVADAALTA